MTIKLLGSLLLVFAAVNIYSFGGGHDSLLFDGANEVQIIQSPPDENCNIKVTKVTGFVLGTRTVREIYEVCGQKDTINRTESAAQLKEGDYIVKKEEIKTGEDGYVKMELNDGSVIVLGPNSSIYIDEDMCETARTFVRFRFGSLWTKIKKLLGGGKFEVSTERACACVRGTEFSVESDGKRDIVRVYESTVEVKMNLNTGELEKSGGDIEKVTKDYQDGKITLEEYMAKVQEFSGKMNEMTESSMNGTMVDAGFMVTVTDKVSTPEPLPAGDTKWFENAKIK